MDINGVSQGGQPVYNTSNVSRDMTDFQGTTVPANNNDIKSVDVDQEKQEKDVKNAIEKINKFLEDKSTHAEYEVHDKFKDIIIKIVDDKTGEVVQEIPSKKILDMVAKMCEMVGIVFDKKA